MQKVLNYIIYIPHVWVSIALGVWFYKDLQEEHFDWFILFAPVFLLPIFTQKKLLNNIIAGLIGFAGLWLLLAICSDIVKGPPVTKGLIKETIYGGAIAAGIISAAAANIYRFAIHVNGRDISLKQLLLTIGLSLLFCSMILTIAYIPMM